MNVSIIIPTFNNLDRLKKVIQSLLNQTGVTIEYEIIVVDNNSNDGTREWLKKKNGIKYIKENIFLNSPYSCRNRGIESSSYEIIALLDSTCIPAPDWLKTGTNYFLENDAEIVGGNVIFAFNHAKKTISEIYDSLINVQMEKSILRRNQAKGGNLWFKKKVIEVCGQFEEGVRSGEDVRWTKHCHSSGVRLDYNDSNIVYYPARKFKPLVKKQLRVAKGKGQIWRRHNDFAYFILKTIKSLLPNSPKRIYKLTRNSKLVEISKIQLFGIYFVSNIISLISAYGYISGFVKKPISNK